MHANFSWYSLLGSAKAYTPPLLRSTSASEGSPSRNQQVLYNYPWLMCLLGLKVSWSDSLASALPWVELLTRLRMLRVAICWAYPWESRACCRPCTIYRSRQVAQSFPRHQSRRKVVQFLTFRVVLAQVIVVYFLVCCVHLLCLLLCFRRVCLLYLCFPLIPNSTFI